MDTMTREQAADYLGIHVSTLDRWHREGTGPPRYQIGGRYEYDPRDLAMWREDRYVDPISMPV